MVADEVDRVKGKDRDRRRVADKHKDKRKDRLRDVGRHRGRHRYRRRDSHSPPESPSMWESLIWLWADRIPRSPLKYEACRRRSKQGS